LRRPTISIDQDCYRTPPKVGIRRVRLASGFRKCQEAAPGPRKIERRSSAESAKFRVLRSWNWRARVTSTRGQERRLAATDRRRKPRAGSCGKILVENSRHKSHKAAMLESAKPLLGDSLSACCALRGRDVDVQTYIAIPVCRCDVVVGFQISKRKFAPRDRLLARQFPLDYTLGSDTPAFRIGTTRTRKSARAVAKPCRD